MFRVLIIEDDQTLLKELISQLNQWDYETFGVEDFNFVMERYNEIQPDLLIIDIQLPKYDGFHWCRTIRSRSDVPIIFLSSRDHPMDMVMAMQLGADDYVQKPFHFEVLLAKIQAILRRTYRYSQSANVDIRIWNQATINFSKGDIHYKDGRVELSKNENSILRILVDQKNQIVSRDELIRALWDDERFISDNTLTVNVNRLRKSLDHLGLGKFIETRIGQGYIAIEE
ncbi:response regulator transcription factor [Oceanobacillus kimchii]|uniref:response regulator transcription factor n=1 Tax=Oceanobacillus kimchii TaxID=746691 RepID=UPI000346BFEA|nr:response regulator transcription factor [Oceanobacillus kimchii]MCT1578807.1 response regulator transcription factor [Oceanobacillus kimchii]MCT2137743.1 response regulator transcription factor [Oceanobacillus kimchii]